MNNNNVKKPLIDRLFPPKYDFEGMLLLQSETTAAGVKELVSWLKAGAKDDPAELSRMELKADDIRHELEHLLYEAFSTPFDRQDMYSISRQMDQVLNFSLSTAVEMRAFEVGPEEPIIKMADALYKGASHLPNGVKMMHLHDKNEKAPEMVRQIRKSIHEVENTYIESMAELFRQKDAVLALKKREIYHHLRDAGRNLSLTTDILHRIIVVLA
jgi:uncharacterized protein Yka (UPF0111/DUF47 family)